MSNSLKFIKEQIASGECEGMENNTYIHMHSINTIDLSNSFNVNLFATSKECMLKNTMDNGKNFYTVIRYDPDSEYEFFVRSRCICDGTYGFFIELAANCLDDVIHFQTFSKNKVPENITEEWLADKTVVCTIGDFVFAEEFSDEFGTKEKPWLKSRFTVMLPIKFEVK